ncbi:MAG: hypothetical protein R3261_03280 [Alphaproteobacteria bacterium]|nr:hypothetical protein [Alphaproteobacteria bacterium]
MGAILVQFLHKKSHGLARCGLALVFGLLISPLNSHGASKASDGATVLLAKLEECGAEITNSIQIPQFDTLQLVIFASRDMNCLEDHKTQSINTTSDGENFYTIIGDGGLGNVLSYLGNNQLHIQLGDQSHPVNLVYDIEARAFHQFPSGNMTFSKNFVTIDDVLATLNDGTPFRFKGIYDFKGQLILIENSYGTDTKCLDKESFSLEFQEKLTQFNRVSLCIRLDVSS